MKDLLKAIKEGSQEAQDYIESLSDSEFLDLAQELDKEANAPEDTQILRDEIRKVVDAVKGIRFPEPLPSPAFPVIPSPIDHKNEINQVGECVKDLKKAIEQQKGVDLSHLMGKLDDYLFACQSMASERPEPLDMAPVVDSIKELKDCLNKPDTDLKPLFDQLEKAIKDNKTIVTGGSGGIGEPEREAMRASAKDSTLQAHLPLDEITGALITTTHPHNEIHKGEMFVYCEVTDLAQDAQRDVLISTGDRYVHIVNTTVTEAEAEYPFFEGVTASNNGTGVTAYNRNRNSLTTPTNSLFHTPTISNTGTTLCMKHWGSGKGSGGDDRGVNEWVLKPNTKYLIRITNFSQTANHTTIELEWYEE